MNEKDFGENSVYNLNTIFTVPLLKISTYIKHVYTMVPEMRHFSLFILMDFSKHDDRISMELHIFCILLV